MRKTLHKNQDNIPTYYVKRRAEIMPTLLSLFGKSVSSDKTKANLKETREGL